MKTITLAFALLPAAVLAQAPLPPDLEKAVSEAIAAGRAAVEGQKVHSEAHQAVRCTFRTIEGRDCVYRCMDGTEYRTRVNQPTPNEPQPIACPQFIWRF